MTREDKIFLVVLGAQSQPREEIPKNLLKYKKYLRKHSAPLLLKLNDKVMEAAEAT